MTQEMQRCPNCGAYVMSNDAICPRCDQWLDELSVQDSENAREPDKPEAESKEPVVDARTPVADEPEQMPAQTLDPIPPPADDDTPANEFAEVDVRGLPTELELGRVDTEASRAPSDALEPGDKGAEVAPVDSAPEPTPAPEPAAVPVSSAASTTARHSTQEQSPDAGIEGDASGGEGFEEDDPLDMTHPAVHLRREVPAHIPPAPYTPPPVIAQSYVTTGYGAPDPHQSPPSASAQAAEFIQHRADLYRRGGYRLRSNRPDEAILTCGKRLGVGGWVLALISLVGLFWYVLLLALSGFQADTAYIVLESDGFIYEDGPGAAHTRRHRMAVGRRWAMFGLMLGVVSIVLGIALGIVAGVVLTQERYQAALREAYPAVTLFEEQFSDVQATPDDVALAKDGAVAFAILAGIAGVGLWGGLTLFVIGTIHAGAYRVDVPPLPGWG